MRDGHELRRAFPITPDYLREAAALDREVNFSDLGLQLTRMARAFKVWVSVQYFGLDAFRKAIDEDVRPRGAGAAADQGERPARARCATRARDRQLPPHASTRDEDLLNARLVAALEESGLGLVSSTRLKGRYTIRMCVMSHTSGPEDVDRVLDFLEQTDVADRDSEPATYERHPDVTLSGVRRRDGGRQARFALLESLPSDEAAHVVAMGEPRRIERGKTVVEQWDTSQDFFLIRSGSVDVLVDGERVARLGPDEFFGEIAALDWGAGFGYPRMAEVVAAEPLEVLVYPDGGAPGLFVRCPRSSG